MTNRQGWWMTLAGGLLACGMLPFGCASGKASRGPASASLEPWQIDYSYQFPFSQRVSFGEFTSSAIGPLMTRGGVTSIGIGQVSHRSSHQTQQLAFEITDRAERRAQLVSQSSIDRTVVDLGRINVPVDTDSNFAGTITLDDGSEWSLTLRRQPIGGQLSRNGRTLVIRKSSASTLLSYEVEFEADGDVVGRWTKRPLKESIWIDNSLPVEERLAIATATTAISLSTRQSESR